MDIATLTARAEIADLIHRYAFNIRRGRLDAFAPLMTEDVEFSVRTVDPSGTAAPIERMRHVGRATLVDYLGRQGEGGLLIVPMIRNLLIDVRGDGATATSLMSSRTWPAGAEVIGEYEDSFRREDHWRFTRRIFTIFTPPPSGTGR